MHRVLVPAALEILAGSGMKVLLVWSGAVVPAYQDFFSELGKQCTLRVLAPLSWVHGSKKFDLAAAPDSNPDFALIPARFWRLGGARYFVPKFLWELLRFQPDVLYFMDEADRVSTLCHFACARLLCPRALRINYNLQNLPAPSYHRWHHRLCLRWNIALLQGAVAANAEAATVLRGHGYRGPMANIPLFASEKIFFPASPTDKMNLRRRFGVPEKCLLLIYAGSLSKAKGVDLLLQAIPRHAGLFLLLAGSGELESEAKSLPSSQGRYLGPLPLPRLRELYQCGDCVILASRDTPAWKEQVGRMLLEAILCGCLGLGSDSSFIPELLDTPETIFPQANADALDAFLGRLPLAQSYKLWEKQRGRVRQHFSAAVVGQLTGEFFQQQIGAAK